MIQLPEIDGGFRCVVADPPWPFDNAASRGAAEDHYRTMTMEQIIYLPVRHVTALDAHLYLWVVDGRLEEAFHVMRAWGFTFKQHLTWVKVSDEGKLQIGTGNYFRHTDELCLFGTRKPGRGRVKNLPSTFWAPRGQHSAKPEYLQTMAEQFSHPPGLELFARRHRPGWLCWGNELPEVSELNGNGGTEE